jgi:hypothetical protein
MTATESVQPGRRWLETATGRTIVIIKSEVHGTGPAWTYEDEPNGWYYCDVADFFIWDRFKLIEEPTK